MADCNRTLPKYSGIYRCPDDISYFKIKIKIKEIKENQKQTKNEWLEKEFTWQEKHFSKTEKVYYSEEGNCHSMNEKNYHEQLKNLEESNENCFLFSYINDDGFSPEMHNKQNYLQVMIEKLHLSDERETAKEYDFCKSLTSSIENTIIQNDSEKMFLMVDVGEYFENTWLQNERVLCEIKYEPKTKVLQVYPDFTTNQYYTFKVKGETTRTYCYFIENTSTTPNGKTTITTEEDELVKKINTHKQYLKQQYIGTTFDLPPKNKLYIYILLEITCAKNFEYPDIYVQYFIDLPETWRCRNPETLTGRTQICHSKNDEQLAHFGYCFETVLEYNIQNLQKTDLPRSPYIYFEIISKDSWERYRTEGLCYKNLPISSPGPHSYTLPAYRFTSSNPGADLRRFFIGDCQNYDDVTWIGVPRDYQENIINKYGVNTISTGQLFVRMNILHQSQAFLEEFDEGIATKTKEKLIFDKLNSSRLIKSVEQVLEAFKKARRNMLEARKNV